MVLRTFLRVTAIAVGTMFVGLVGAILGIWSLSPTLAVVLRSVLAIALLLALTRAFRMSDRKSADQAGRPHPQVLMAAGLAYVVNLAAWGGQPLFGQLLTSVGVLSALLDLAVWMAVAVLGVRLGDHARVHASTAPVPYA